ncbi:MAG: efflux RND transporter periplasmic adaptor subunit [Planctomycetales bacterium]
MWTRLIGILVVAVLLVGLLAFSQQQTPPLKVSGFIEADDIRVGSRIGGRVKTVKVEEGAEVRPGDVLVELDPFDLLDQRAQAQGVLAERQAAWEKMKNGYRPEEIIQAEERVQQLAAVLKKLKNGPREQEIRSAEARRDERNAEYKLSQDKYQRGENLRAKGANTQQDLDQLETEMSVAQNALRAAREDLDLLKAGTRPEEIEEAAARLKESEAAAKLIREGNRREDIDQAVAAVQAAKSALAAIDQQIGELTVKSPVQGSVEAVDLRPGDLVGANTPAVTLLDRSRLWVRAYVPENRMGLQLDQVVTVTVDSFPNRRFKGRLTFISRQAEFTPGNVQTPEERSKQVFRIKVMLDDKEDLRPGMSADVWLQEIGRK